MMDDTFATILTLALNQFAGLIEMIPKFILSGVTCLQEILIYLVSMETSNLYFLTTYTLLQHPNLL